MMLNIESHKEALMKVKYGQSECRCLLPVDLLRPVWPRVHTRVMPELCSDE